jgi:hypothetical protein
MDRNAFELRRQIDDLIYVFRRTPMADGGFGYKRTDGEFWIIRHPQFGWVAWGAETGEVEGRPWNVLPEQQVDYPPVGDWVSRKGAKSYVYSLVYLFDGS